VITLTITQSELHYILTGLADTLRVQTRDPIADYRIEELRERLVQVLHEHCDAG
jgi:hypothetical protein